MNHRLNRVTGLLIGAALTLAACGQAGSSSDPGHSNSVAEVTTRTGPLPTSPGAITIGSAGFPESELLANVYAEAMRAKGVKVTVRANIGERPAYVAALQDGSIGAVPEYTGAILDYLDNGNPARSPAEVYAKLRLRAAEHGYLVSDYAEAQNVDTITVTQATATKYHLTSIGDLKDVAPTLTLGAPAPFRTTSYGLPALRDTYGVTFGRFVPLAPSGSITQTALRNGTVDAADIFSTDPSFQTDDFVALTDPEHIFAAENVTLLLSNKTATQPMLDAANSVAAELTTDALTTLGEKVANGTSPASAAEDWLKAQGLT